jgi:hypothetical protein
MKGRGEGGGFGEKGIEVKTKTLTPMYAHRFSILGGRHMIFLFYCFFFDARAQVVDFGRQTHDLLSSFASHYTRKKGGEAGKIGKDRARAGEVWAQEEGAGKRGSAGERGGEGLGQEEGAGRRGNERERGKGWGQQEGGGGGEGPSPCARAQPDAKLPFKSDLNGGGGVMRDTEELPRMIGQIPKFEGICFNMCILARMIGQVPKFEGGLFYIYIGARMIGQTPKFEGVGLRCERDPHPHPSPNHPCVRVLTSHSQNPSP